MAGWPLTLALFFGLIGLTSAIFSRAEAPNPWRWVPLALINLALQPVFCWITAESGYVIGMASFGRLAYGFRTLSAAELESNDHKRKCRKRLGLGGSSCFSFAGAFVPVSSGPSSERYPKTVASVIRAMVAQTECVRHARALFAPIRP